MQHAELSRRRLDITLGDVTNGGMWTHGTSPRLRTASYTAKRTYFVTFCVLGRAPVFGDPGCASAASDVILRYRKRGYYFLPAYCVMPDHVHLLILPTAPGRHLSRIVATIKNAIAYDLRGMHVGVRWQWGYYDRLLRTSDSTRQIAKYVVMNPVRKGLVTDFRDWRYGGIIDKWF